MSKLIDISGRVFGKFRKIRPGQIFGRLKTIRRLGWNKGGRVLWECECECERGKRTIVTSDNLLRKQTRSCGCLNLERVASMGRQTVKHGALRGGRPTPTYASWRAMIKRCTCVTASDFPRYGGSGITFCWRWSNKNPDGFVNFRSDMGERPSLDMTLDRYPNPDGHYFPENTRWATKKQQSWNRRATKLTLEGARKVRALLAAGETKEAIAGTFNVSSQTVLDVARGRTWREDAVA